MRNRGKSRVVRESSSELLHALAHHLVRKSFEGVELSEGQEGLFQSLVRELEYRHRRTGTFGKRCYCRLCFGPFPAEGIGEGAPDEDGADPR